MSIKRFLIFFVLFLLVGCVFSKSQQNSSPSDETIWFVLEGGSKTQMPLIPILNVKGHIIQDVPQGCVGPDGQDAGYKNFENKYIQPGQSHQALFGGAEAGTITVNEPDPDFGRGYGTYHGDAPIHGRIYGLAVSARQRTKSRSSRKPATAGQQAAATKLAKTLFTKAGVAQSLLAKLKIENITVSTFSPSTEEKILASFSVEDENGNRHAAFFIAKPGEEALAQEFAWMHVTKSEDQVQVMTFVDQADLFRDGREEAIAEVSYYENWSYLVLLRVDSENMWVKIFETDILGCE